MNRGDKKKNQRIELLMPVDTYIVNCKCPKCDRGLLIQSKRKINAIVGNQFPHRCNSCGHIEMITGRHYPDVEYKPIKPEDDNTEDKLPQRKI
jgi:hypothetical protein